MAAPILTDDMVAGTPHALFLSDPAGATAVAVAETGVEPRYAERAWAEYTTEGIFPPDGDASDAAVQALIEISALIRAVPDRRGRTAADYIERRYLHEARR